MKTNDKTGFTVNGKPTIMLNTGDFNNSLIRMPFIRVQVKKGQNLKPHIIKQRCKVGTLVADGSVANRDVEGGMQDQTDVVKRILAKIKHRQDCNDQV